MNWGSFCFLGDQKLLKEKVYQEVFVELSRQKLKKNQTSIETDRSSKKNHLIFNMPPELLNLGEASPLYKGPKVDTLYEDQNLLVVEKPPLIHSLAHQYSDQNSMSSWLRSIHPHIYESFSQLKVKDRQDRGAIFRLDFETSGVFAFAKNIKTYQFLRESFHKIFYKKIYLAILGGIPDWSETKISLAFESRGAKGHRVRAIPMDQVGGDSISKRNFQLGDTKIKCLNKLGGKTLVEIEITGGARHQIRSSCAYLGVPLWADALYGEKKEGEHFWLHAQEYHVQDFPIEISILKSDYLKKFQEKLKVLV